MSVQSPPCQPPVSSIACPVAILTDSHNKEHDNVDGRVQRKQVDDNDACSIGSYKRGNPARSKGIDTWKRKKGEINQSTLALSQPFLSTANNSLVHPQLGYMS
jgi:hypothetical protein